METTNYSQLLNSDRYKNDDDFSYRLKPNHIRRKQVISSLVEQATKVISASNQPTNGVTQILEIGIGNGDLAETYINNLNSKGFKVFLTGLELSAKPLSLTKEGLVQKFVVCPVENIVIPSNSQDIVVMSEVLEHTRTPILALKQIHRVLKERGFFIGSVPNIGQIWDVIKIINGDAPHQIKRKIYDPLFPHESHFTMNLLKESLKKAGFSEIKITTNQIYLFPTGEKTVPVINALLEKFWPRFGDRLIWCCRK